MFVLNLGYSGILKLIFFSIRSYTYYSHSNCYIEKKDTNNIKSKPILRIGLGEQKMRQIVSGNEFRPDKPCTCTRKELIEPCMINKLNGCPEILTA